MYVKIRQNKLTVKPIWLLGVTLELRRTGGGGFVLFTDDLLVILEMHPKSIVLILNEWSNSLKYCM